MDLGAWGVEEGFWDALGQWHDVPRESLELIARAMGASDERAQPPDEHPVWCVRAGHPEFLQAPADIALEEGTVLRGVDVLPPDLPLGYHELLPHDGGPATRLVVGPGRCHLPPDLHTWGWAVQL